MKKLVATLCLTALTLLPMTAFGAHHLNGTWVLEVTLGDGQGGQATIDLEEGEGGQLTGSYSGALGEAEVTGKVDGEKVEFSFDSQAGTISYEGTVSGTTMKGTCSYGQLGEGTFEGSKKE